MKEIIINNLNDLVCLLGKKNKMQMTYFLPSTKHTRDSHGGTFNTSNINASLYIRNTISNTRLKLTKYQANAKQHPEAELFTFENYSDSSTTL